ncbi:YcxB family protein [Kitasatospora sp. NPDC058162]|uniref:YcxB family protein n=1 Tax=Kitasatospora sp. NPDC058162 TaxID=3346362 RepID=UPI0036DEC618
MSIQVTYELTADQAYHGVRRANRRRFALVRACCAVLLACGIVLLATGGQPVLGSVLVVVAPLLAFWQSYATRLRVARHQAENPGPLTIAFADSGCAFTTGGFRQAFAWSRFTRIADDRDHLFLYARRELPVAVPKSVFHPYELGELMRVLQSRPNYRPSRRSS